MKKLTYWLMVAVLLCGVSTGMAQQRNKAYEDYIKKYRSIAVDEMKHYRIPASITLAQGLLESGAGRSELARKSNNHFGIKCGGSWDGRSVRHTDDAPNECFRAYKHAKDSYRDHSKSYVSIMLMSRLAYLGSVAYPAFFNPFAQPL